MDVGATGQALVVPLLPYLPEHFLLPCGLALGGQGTCLPDQYLLLEPVNDGGVVPYDDVQQLVGLLLQLEMPVKERLIDQETVLESVWRNCWSSTVER